MVSSAQDLHAQDPPHPVLITLPSVLNAMCMDRSVDKKLDEGTVLPDKYASRVLLVELPS
jgi:hypothetical protein